jgi:hypothetical protein
MEPVLLLASITGSYAIARNVSKLPDMKPKTHANHIEHVVALFAFVTCILYMSGFKPGYAHLLVVPITALIYGAFASLRGLQADTVAPTPGLIAAMVISGLAVAAIWMWVYVSQEMGIAPLVAVAFVLAFFISYYMTVRTTQTEPPHIHHWMIGLALSTAFAGFSDSYIAQGMFGIGMGVAANGVAVYEPAGATSRVKASS